MARHDSLFRFVLQDPARAGNWLRSVLPRPMWERIHWASLTPASARFVRDTLRSDEVDLLFRVRTHDGLGIWILIEHKSSAVRVLDQVGRYVFELRRHAPFAGGPIPAAVLPVIVYHGDAPLPFAPTASAPAAPIATGAELVAALEPRIQAFAEDLSASSEQDLLGRELDDATRLAFLCLCVLRRLPPDGVIAALHRWRDLLVTIDRDRDSGARVLRAVAWYCLAQTEVATTALRDAFEALLNRPDDFIMSTAERIRREGFERGVLEGETRGEARAQVETLLSLMARRFGPLASPVTARVRSASPAEVERWLGRILDADGIDSLLA